MVYYKRQKYSILFTLVTLGSVVLWFALFYTGSSYVHADSVNISNSISASANTGHNKAENGEVVEGKGRASVFIETTRNGEIVEHIEESEEVQEGSVEISVQTHTTDTSSTSSVSIRVNETQSSEDTAVPQAARSEDLTASVSSAVHIPSEKEESHASSTEAGEATSTPSIINSEEEATTSTTVGTQSSSIVAHVVDLFASLVSYVTTLFSKASYPSFT